MALRAKIDLTRVYGIIEDEIIPTLQDQYESDGRKASGKLIKSLEKWDASFEDDVFTLNLNIPDYWYWLEVGRKPTSGITGIPWKDPVSDISTWIVNKKIPIPKGKTLTSFAKAIVSKIHKKGFIGSGSLYAGVKKCDKYFDDIADDIGTQLGREVIAEIDKL